MFRGSKKKLVQGERDEKIRNGTNIKEEGIEETQKYALWPTHM